VVAAIESAFAREELVASTLDALDADEVVIAPTANRRVLGYLNETGHACRNAVELAVRGRPSKRSDRATRRNSRVAPANAMCNYAVTPRA